ncbi:PREDICTED: RING-H2 finger protein ATL7-like isoform X2 [Lupinus angustifolius]|nr:PREDICTED: RING-H2 finger protein ATL7-like isoform X2 [Lupinus angustifolius]
MTSRGYYSSPITTSSNSSDCCSNRSDGSASASTELKIYRAFIFSVPIFFTFILLFLFYIFYLRPRRVDWSSLRMRPLSHNNIISTSDMGLKKELREMLPIIVYKESFSVKDTQCSVCLLEYQADDKLQQIPACGHTFHMSCIDLWLANHSTCPLCRLSLLTCATSSTETSNVQRSQSNEETQVTEFSESRSTRPLEIAVSGEVATNAHCIDVEGQNAVNNQ